MKACNIVKINICGGLQKRSELSCIIRQTRMKIGDFFFKQEKSSNRITIEVIELRDLVFAD